MFKEHIFFFQKKISIPNFLRQFCQLLGMLVRMFYNCVKFLYLEFCHVKPHQSARRAPITNFGLIFQALSTLWSGCFSILSNLLHFSYILLISKIYWATTQQYFPYLSSKDVEIYEVIKVIIIKYLYRLKCFISHFIQTQFLSNSS